MKKIAYIILMGIVLGFPSCKNAESPYEEYVVLNGHSYPGKALNLAANPGRERIEIAWQNSADPKVVKARISWNNDSEWVEVDINKGADTIKRILDQMEENTYSFLVRTYDAVGNVSVPAEVIGNVYGELYERSLVNRSVKSVEYDELDKSLKLEWNGADATEIGLNLAYTDINDNSRTLLVEKIETATTIPDFKAGESVFCTTMYKPDSAAIDIFNSPPVRIQYYGNITYLLQNTEFPFTRGDLVHSNRYYEAPGWIVNPEAAVNGNVDINRGNTLLMIAWGGHPSLNVINGKLYQTVELEAGSYRFIASINESTNTITSVYTVVALGNDLPDVADLEAQALAIASVPAGIATGAVQILTLEFELSEKSFVSLGFVANLTADQQVHFRKVELWKKF